MVIFSMMGVGLQGLNGLHSKVTINLWNSYIIQRLVYGLEILKLTGKFTLDLEQYQRMSLQCIHNLLP